MARHHGAQAGGLTACEGVSERELLVTCANKWASMKIIKHPNGDNKSL
jgi:hypothetical protein